MGTPYYHTDDSAYESIKNYQDLHGIAIFNEALDEMYRNLDDLDIEDRSAVIHYVRNIELRKKNGTKN